MSDPRPWDTGDDDANWVGYFNPGSTVLRNRVSATTREELLDSENDLVEVRVAELRDDPTNVARTLGCSHPQTALDITPECGVRGREGGRTSWLPAGLFDRGEEFGSSDVEFQFSRWVGGG